MKERHGANGTREYRIWCNMKTRCLNPNTSAYKNYGGRGIQVCARWALSFSCFLEDMGACPPDRSIDRINNDGDYAPGNCRWATRKEQNSNTRTNVFVAVNGESRTLTEWAEITGIRIELLSYRAQAGYSPERFLATPNPNRVQAAKRVHDRLRRIVGVEGQLRLGGAA